jgi:hypothetical protein
MGTLTRVGLLLLGFGLAGLALSLYETTSTTTEEDRTPGSSRMNVLKAIPKKLRKYT